MASTHLSRVEIDILCLIAEGWTDRQIAAGLCKSLDTVHAHRDHILNKTNCHNRVQLTRYAIAHGFVSGAWEGVKIRRMPDDTAGDSGYD
jgi:DNA-binding NarL/FixJ family response regulator